MKRCPQCNKVFEDELLYCKEDGTTLIEEEFTLPSDFKPEDHDDGEQETVLRYSPKNFDISNSKIPKNKPESKVQPQLNQYAPNHGAIPPQTSDKSNRGCLKYATVLLIGFLLGGSFVLGVIGISYFYVNSEVAEKKPVSENKTVEDKRTEKANSNSNSNKKPKRKHSEQKANLDESKLNGKIIRNRSTLRSSPSNRGRRVDRLPKNDRIEIIRRKSPTSKWYEIECEHGVRGWINGNYIKFTE